MLRVRGVHAELLEVIVWLTPAGTEDEGGFKQPAYLNYETGLLGPPHGNEMQVWLSQRCLYLYPSSGSWSLIMQNICLCRGSVRWDSRA